MSLTDSLMNCFLSSLFVYGGFYLFIEQGLIHVKSVSMYQLL